MWTEHILWKWAALMPHPPVLVPEVGRGREHEAAQTLRGLARLTQRLTEARPDVLLLLSPHQPYAPGAFFVNSSPRLSGSLAPFGAPEAAFDIEVPTGKIKTLTGFLSSQGVTVHTGSGRAAGLTQDQGSLVPLYFLERAWKTLPPVIFASPIGLTPEHALKAGRALAALEDDSTWGLLASGDLSHRLTPDAPAGYSLSGKSFDGAVVASLSSNDPRPLLNLSRTVWEDAGECGLRSVMTMLGLCGEIGGTVDVLSYEGPFGVGYCTAVWERGGS